MDYRWITFILFSLALFYLYLQCTYALSRIDRLFKRSFKLGYCNALFSIENIIALKDKKLRDKITDINSTTALDDLLPPERTMVTFRKRRHKYIIPFVRNKRFKRIFVNRCLFYIVS